MSNQVNNAASGLPGRERRPRRNQSGNDPDAAFKDQIKAERRAQVSQNASDQDGLIAETAESDEAMTGDNTRAGDVAQRNNNGRASGSSSRGQNRPATKGPPRATAAQVGAVAAAGRAFGAPMRPLTAPSYITRSIEQGLNYQSSDEEEARQHEAVAMRAVTVEDDERERRRQRKVQEEASRLAQEIRDESKTVQKEKKKPYKKVTVVVGMAEDDAKSDASSTKVGELAPKPLSDSARRWKRIAMSLQVSLALAIMGFILLIVLQTRD